MFTLAQIDAMDNDEIVKYSEESSLPIKYSEYERKFSVMCNLAAHGKIVAEDVAILSHQGFISYFVRTEKNDLISMIKLSLRDWDYRTESFTRFQSVLILSRVGENSLVRDLSDDDLLYLISILDNSGSTDVEDVYFLNRLKRLNGEDIQIVHSAINDRGDQIFVFDDPEGKGLVNSALNTARVMIRTSSVYPFVPRVRGAVFNRIELSSGISHLLTLDRFSSDEEKEIIELRIHNIKKMVLSSRVVDLSSLVTTDFMIDKDNNIWIVDFINAVAVI